MANAKVVQFPVVARARPAVTSERAEAAIKRYLDAHCEDFGWNFPQANRLIAKHLELWLAVQGFKIVPFRVGE